mmetsp:Transcript_41456/g.95009  ORF Transcript_41456/g.95009 Transcript_41456/m.95009 type:complete len:88 (-) Transcript_41456:15-278(-)
MPRHAPRHARLGTLAQACSLSALWEHAWPSKALFGQCRARVDQLGSFFSRSVCCAGTIRNNGRHRESSECPFAEFEQLFISDEAHCC